jgi:hypothetical protein
LSRLSIEHKQMSHLRHLRDGVHATTGSLDRDEVRRTWDIEVPQIMVHNLEVPHAFSCIRPQGQHAVAKQVLPDPIAAPMIVARRTRSAEDPASGRI